MLAPCWPILGPMLRLCWWYVRPSLLKYLQDANFSFPDPSAEPKTMVFPQQRKLMGSSAQNSSGVHWCRRRVRSTRFRRKFRRRSGRLWCRARSGSTGFRRRFRRRPGSLDAKPSQVSTGSTGFRRRFRSTAQTLDSPAWNTMAVKDRQATKSHRKTA